ENSNRHNALTPPGYWPPQPDRRLSRGSLQFSPGSGDGEPTMFDAFRANQRVGDFTHGAGLAAHHQDLQAVVMIQMHVQRGENRAMVIVLHIGQLLIEQTDMVIVNQGDGPDHARFRRLSRLFYQLIPGNIATSY